MNADVLLSTTRDDPRTLVVVFLRGGADGLSLVPPIHDDDYHLQRPRIAVKRADAVPLDGFFGLHPNLRPLEAAWKEGDLVVIHGAGGESDSRSHFEAQDLMEHGGVAAGGWLGRFLRARGGTSSPLSAVALSATLPEALSGAPGAAAFQSLDEFALTKRKDESPEKFALRERGEETFHRELRRLYELETGHLHAAAASTFETMKRIARIDLKTAPAHAAEYDESDSFARGLRQVAQLIRADVGLQAASVDLDGWDSHFAQLTLVEPLTTRLGKGLAAFRQDLGPRMATTTVVVMTEFGRRVRENSAFGTDHGRGSVMFVMGGGVKGGRVIGQRTGLNETLLEGPGDLPVVHNYRNILAPILTRHGAPAENLPRIFPDFLLAPLELYG